MLLRASTRWTRRRVCAPWAAGLLLAALGLAGCGSGGAANQHRVSFGGRGDSATFVLDGRSISVTESGTASVRVAQAPEVTYSGPVGCAGRYFAANLTEGVRLFFHYGASDAYLLLGSDLYYLGGAARRVAGRLQWQTTTGGHRILVRVSCPEPPRTGRLAGSATPPACGVLTAAIATSALHEGVREPRFVQENPQLSYCEYKSKDPSLHSSRRLAVYVATAGQLRNLSSWSQPRISGIGDEAHGGDPSLGLAVRRGKLGIEVDADLGFGAGEARNLAVEEAVARKLVGELAR